jgi:hypothetical protein
VNDFEMLASDLPMSSGATRKRIGLDAVRSSRRVAPIFGVGEDWAESGGTGRLTALPGGGFD